MCVLCFSVQHKKMKFVWLFICSLFLPHSWSLDCSQDSLHPECQGVENHKRKGRQLQIVFTGSYLDIGYFNGITFRQQRGVSGPISSTIYLAEALAARDHKVIYISDKIQESMIGVNQVTYYNATNVLNVHCDILITTSNLYDLAILRGDSNTRILGIVMHSDFQYFEFFADKILQLSHHNVIFFHVSRYAMWNILNEHEWMRNYQNILLPNTLDLREIPYPITLIQKRNHFVYFTNVQTAGGKKAAQLSFTIAQTFPDFKFITMYYPMNHTLDDHYHTFPTDTHYQLTFPPNGNHNTSRSNIYQVLYASKYFIYPCYDNQESMFTYYAVLEALLHGVIVIVPRQLASQYMDLFGDAIVYIESTESESENDVISRYHEKIQQFEENAELYVHQIAKGIALRERFSNVRIATRLEALLYEELDRVGKINLQDVELLGEYSPSRIF